MKQQLIRKISLSLGLMAASLLQSAAAYYQPDQLQIKRNAVSSPAEFLRTHDDSNYWFAYRVPAPENTRSMCCWQGGKYHEKNYGCSLNGKNYGFGNTSDAPYTDTITVFSQVRKGQVTQLLTVGEQCPIEADGITVEWLTDVSEKNSMDWLTQLIKQPVNGRKKDHVADNALYSLAYHNSPRVNTELYQLATSERHSIAGNAVFWLGQRADGFGQLKRLYEELPAGETRKKINFSLAENSDPEAWNMLKTIAMQETHREQRKDAIFWLSQSEREDALETLQQILHEATDTDVMEQTIFALSQLKQPGVADILLQLAEDHPRQAVKEKALFWLAQNNPEKAQASVMQLLQTQPSDKGWNEHLIFVLSQLPKPQGDDALFAVLDGSYPRAAKKQALFWLSQSSEHSTIERLSERL